MRHFSWSGFIRTGAHALTKREQLLVKERTRKEVKREREKFEKVLETGKSEKRLIYGKSEELKRKKIN